jgi:hypothetical protein
MNLLIPSIVLTAIASWLLMQFDQSKFAKLMAQKTFGIFLK